MGVCTLEQSGSLTKNVLLKRGSGLINLHMRLSSQSNKCSIRQIFIHKLCTIHVQKFKSKNIPTNKAKYSFFCLVLRFYCLKDDIFAHRLEEFALKEL